MESILQERYCTGKTSHGRFGGSFDSPIVDAIVSCGNPILNSSLDGFIKVGGVNCFSSCSLIEVCIDYPIRCNEPGTAYLQGIVSQYILMKTLKQGVVNQ
jgi:hypothetical protein